MKHIARAPVRLGLAGGGTDVASYADHHGGAVVNVTISRYASTIVEQRDDDQIAFVSTDLGCTSLFPAHNRPHYADECPLQLATLRRVTHLFGVEPPAITVTTHVDVSPGSGLGSSSALVVSMIAALAQWQRVELGTREIAELAYEIERFELGSACGRQDQYAAAFGGLNFMEFSKNHVAVTPLAVADSLRNQLPSQLLLFDTGTTRTSSDVIGDQTERVLADRSGELQAMHELRRLAHDVRRGLEDGDVVELGRVLGTGMEQKLRSSALIGANGIAELYRAAIRLGADGGKVSGAGGGGFLLLSCPPDSRTVVIDFMTSQGCSHHQFDFVADGVRSWAAD